jgi:hypothetical protein
MAALQKHEELKRKVMERQFGCSFHGFSDRIALPGIVHGPFSLPVPIITATCLLPLGLCKEVEMEGENWSYPIQSQYTD